MNPASLNLRHLRAVVAIAETGSISAACRRVNLTQPAITHGIAKIERQIGMPLFDRQPGGMAPTEAARLLVPRAEAALEFIGGSAVTGPQVRAFVSLARHGSYTAAASAEGMREASLHRAVSDLSAAMGQRLVERRGRGVVLTSRGLAVARRFRLADAELRAALAELQSLQGREVGRVVIGAMPLSRARLLPNAIGAFVRDNQAARVSVLEGSYNELIGPLRDGDVDLLIGALREEPIAEDIVQEPLLVDRPIILGRSNHPLARLSRPPTVAELAAFPWIVPGERTPLRRQWAQIFSACGIDPPPVPIECGSVIVVRQLLLQGDFLTLLSSDQVAVELEAQWLVRIGPAPGDPSRTLGTTVRAGWRPTPLQSAFLSCLRQEAAKLGQ
jgi:DNA-binding transcriptional LysR family regulator